MPTNNKKRQFQPDGLNVAQQMFWGLWPLHIAVSICISNLLNGKKTSAHKSSNLGHLKVQQVSTLSHPGNIPGWICHEKERGKKERERVCVCVCTYIRTWACLKIKNNNTILLITRMWTSDTFFLCIPLQPRFVGTTQLAHLLWSRPWFSFKHFASFMRPLMVPMTAVKGSNSFKLSLVGMEIV